MGDQPSNTPKLLLSAHAARVLDERNVQLCWVEETISEPQFSEPDPDDAGVMRLFRQIDAAEGKWLRVVIRPGPSCALLITAFFDRSRLRSVSPKRSKQ
jgi:hypothetical protein